LDDDQSTKTFLRNKNNRGYDLKVVNPIAKPDQETRTPAELLDFIAARSQEVATAMQRLRE